jgi:hypothetical protein
MKRIYINLFLVFVLAVAFGNTAHAAATDINLTVRDGATIVFSGAVPLEPAGTINLNDSSSVPHSFDADSVLSVLNDADISSSAFSISNLTYDNSYSSFYVKCITDPVGNECDNWQYAVNNSYPAVGMDKDILLGGENVYVYFGPQYKVVLGSNTITTADNLTVTADQYDYQKNVWQTRTGVTVGLTQPDPNNTWTPIEVKTGVVDANGQAIFSAIPAGSYNVGIQQDYYFPTESLTVKPAPVVVSAEGTESLTVKPAPVVVSAEESGHIVPALALKPIFSVPNAISYLKSAQSADGSFGNSDLYTDWAAIALGAGGISNSSLLSYMNAHSVLSSNLTDNERHAMALLALGQNPYSFNGVNYIKAITDSFAGKQFGDSSLVNDDIFALIPLQSAGYTASDDVIAKDIQFIFSKEQADGSWEESVDLTAAAIQALKPFDSVSGVSDALIKAGTFIASAQESDGGWKNVSSTSWAMQAMNVLGTSWTKNGNSGFDYLATNQATDGAVSPTTETLQNRIWATSYVIPALLGKSWSDVMHPVIKQVISTNEIVVSTQINPTKDVIKKVSVVKPKINPESQSKEINNTSLLTASVVQSVTPKTQMIEDFIVAFFRNLLHNL